MQYKQYRDNKKSIKLNKAIARKMDMEVSPAGSEENIKSPSQWKAQYVDDLTDDEELDTASYMPRYEAFGAGAGTSTDAPGWGSWGGV